ncbi:MAG: hypothetical protein HZB29_01870 [Nitrospinae bacterium]|nr:hypothetical protein [Nitrospinota bacterium]
MSVEKLLAAISAEADLKEREIFGEAAHKADAVMSGAKSRAAELDRAIEMKKREIALRGAALDAARKRMEDRSVSLESFNAAVEDILGIVRTMYRRFIDEPGYGAFVTAELARAGEEAGRISEVHADEKTAAVLKKAGVPNVIADETVADGFTAMLEDGRKAVTCALEPRLAKLWRMYGWKFAARIAAAAEENGN